MSEEQLRSENEQLRSEVKRLQAMEAEFQRYTEPQIMEPMGEFFTQSQVHVEFILSKHKVAETTGSE